MFYQASFKTKKLTLDGRRVELAIWVSSIFTEKFFFEILLSIRIQQDKNDFKHLGIYNQSIKHIFYFYFDFSPLYYREANGAILVFDITDDDSFERVC